MTKTSGIIPASKIPPPSATDGKISGALGAFGFAITKPGVGTVIDGDAVAVDVALTPRSTLGILTRVGVSGGGKINTVGDDVGKVVRVGGTGAVKIK
jgi:hypothetical protein